MVVNTVATTVRSTCSTEVRPRYTNIWRRRRRTKRETEYNPEWLGSSHDRFERSLSCATINQLFSGCGS
jgi:hypothetical protein